MISASEKNKTGLGLILLGITLIVIFRLLPHYPNFTPVGAVALFAGSVMTSKRWAFLLPIGGLFISDMIIGFHYTMPFVYASFFISILIGMYIGEKRTMFRVLGASVTGSLLFFLISNLGAWPTLYDKTFAGLLQAYIMAIPFSENTSISQILFVSDSFSLANTIWGDLAFNTILFGGYYLLAPKPKEAVLSAGH